MSRTLRAAGLLVLFGVLISAARPVLGQELRAFWADAFSPAIKSREEVDTLLRRLRTANCNAVFVQVRKGGDAYYVSRYEPWASDNPQRFDGLGYLIEQAHAGRPRIEVHAWINTCAVGRSRGNPLHVALAHPEWLSISDKGEDYDGEATKIDPGHPDAADQTFRVYMDVLRHYDVDGIHFDFVRYGGAAWGYNPVSVARFNARHGRTGTPAASDPLWQQWRRDQVTALVRKVYAMSAAIKPRVAVSAATITWGAGPRTMDEWRAKTAAMTRVFQDWRAWMEEGILDVNCMMSYYSEARHAEWYRLWLDWAKDHQYRRFAVPSSGIWLNSIQDSFKQIEAIRAPSKNGNRARGGVLLYCYSTTNRTADGQEQRYNEDFYRALAADGPQGKGPFVRKSIPPTMPWKTAPKTGHIKGFVFDTNSLLPVDGAQVTASVGASRNGSSARRSARSDGTGFYAFVDLPPGRATVTVSGAGYVAKSVNLTIARGKAASATFYVGAASSPDTPSLEALRKARDGAQVRLRNALVVGGSDHFPGVVCVVTPSETVAMQTQLADRAGLPFQAGDLVAVNGILGTVDGERVVRDATIRLIDMRIPDKEEGTTAWRPPGMGVPPLGALLAPGVVRVTGIVKSVGPDLATLDGGVPIEVPLTGRKECGVEDAETPIECPPILSKAEVTGVVTLGLREGRPFVRVRPRTFQDVRVLTPQPVVLARMAAQTAAAPIVMWGVYLWKRGDDGR